MFTEKDEKIVAAVFASRGKPHGGSRECSHISIYINEDGHYDAGLVAFTTSNVVAEFWDVICTIEEYNQCLEDMARAEWIGDGVWHYGAYINNCKTQNIDTSNKELLKDNCDDSFYDKPLVYTQDEYLHVKIEDAGNYHVNELFFHWGSNLTVPIKDVDAGVFIINQHKLVRKLPIKTPEQIKQDRLDDHLKEIVDEIVKNHEVNHWGYSRSVLFSDVKKAYELGYIVEPK